MKKFKYYIFLSIYVFYLSLVSSPVISQEKRSSTYIEKYIEEFISERSYFHNFRTPVDVNVSECVMTAEIKFLRRCELDIEKSAVTHMRYRIDLREFEEPILDRQNKTRTIIFFQDPSVDINTSYRDLEMCDGSEFQEKINVFSVVINKNFEIDEIFEMLKTYKTQFCHR